jgi:transposase-like protein
MTDRKKEGETMAKTKAQAIEVSEIIRLMKSDPGALPKWVRQAEDDSRIKVHDKSLTLRASMGDRNMAPDDFLVMDGERLTSVSRAVWDLLPNG